MSKCLTCGEPIEQKKGKRKRLYCSDTCRLRAWNDKARSITKPKPIIQGPIKEVLKEASEEIAKLSIEAMIAAIKAEKIPPNRDTPMGRKSWLLDQKKRISELESKLK